ncbi:MAG: hypothetical protein LBS75_10365 [Synergistaceae bacterium]|jgi:hypothetical protein|nr:hypothetical protein [Synergistaceae bacterium]
MFMKRAIVLLAVLSLSSSLSAPDVSSAAEPSPGEGEAQSSSVVVEREHGLIDWSRNYIEASGMAVAPEGSGSAQGKALARRGAIVDLQRNLLEFLGGVQVDARTTMDNFMAEDRVRTEVHGIIRNIELLDGTWDGESYTVTGRVRLPQLLAIVTPNIKEIEERAPRPKQPAAPPKTAGKFTGLVIDARHLQIAPSLSFRVIDEGEREVYGISFADPKFAAQSGLATYYNNIEYAKGELRVAANPIVTKAVKLSGDGVSIVIPNSAASRVRGSSYDFRRECKVIIVCR